ncbi:hypothetical protein ACJMK2_014949 [Sinanodonta woodiana]|uniref:BTB domain-containing protein n=1 Tax=Sinanodonta woodiana TaxID=1069815 RepID=A0ABD3V272_SINWO
MSDIAMKFRSALDAEEYCDVELKLKSGSLLKCHSVVLLMNSDFFRGRLQSRWTTKETPTIDCTMFPDDIVEHLVKFMYGIHFPLHMSNIHDTIQCCDYFGASELLDKCVQFLIDGISCDYVFTILLISEGFPLLSVKNKCFEFIDCNMENLLCNSEGFFTLPLALIVQIISRDTLSVHEELLFDHLILWVEQQTVDLEPIWEKLSGHIRFLSMSVEYFITKCIPLNVLPNEVSNQILMYLTVCEPFDVQGIKVNVVSRCITTRHDVLVKRFFRKSVDASWISDAMNGDRINFIVNTGATLKGVSLYGSAGQSFIYTVSLHEAGNGHLIQKSKCKLDFVSDVCTFPFKTSCLLAADVTYTLVAIREGPAVFYGVNGVLSNHVHVKEGRKLEIKFEKADVGSSTIFEGQFEGLLFSTVD